MNGPNGVAKLGIYYGRCENYLDSMRQEHGNTVIVTHSGKDLTRFDSVFSQIDL